MKADLVSRLIQYRKNHPKGNTNTIKDKVLLKDLLEYPEFIDLPVNQKAAALVLGISELPKCECGNPVEFVPNYKDITPFGGWRQYCCRLCLQRSKTALEKRKATNIEKYGYDFPAKTPENRAKASQPKTEEQKSIANEKTKKTNQAKYGKDYYTQTDEYLEKRAQTVLEQTGGKYTNHFQDVEKIQARTLEKYGVLSWRQTEEGRKHSRENNAMKNEEISKKSAYNRRLKKYGEILCQIITDNDADRFRAHIYDIVAQNDFQFRQQIADHMNLSKPHLNSLFRRFGMANEFISLGTAKSYEEQTLFNFIASIYSGPMIRGNRSLLGNAQEVDIFLPEMKIGFEYDSPYTHSELKRKDEFYHVTKTNLAGEAGFELLHIFGNEWTVKPKRKIWESIIQTKLGLIENRIIAKACKLQEIPVDDAFSFFDENDLTGGIKAEFNLGLFHNDELVSAISYGESRFDENEVEIFRFATKLCTIVDGAFKKFITSIAKKNLSIMVDRRVDPLGTSCDNIFKNKVRYEPSWYLFQVRNFNDFQHQWDLNTDIEKLLPTYDDSLPLIYNLSNCGYDRIFNCGYWKFSNAK